jgi:ubiquinone/menaquinone biosynthesis C-methylase UbiE
MDDEAAQGSVYLQAWHDRHTGSTTSALRSITDEHGHNTYEVLAEAMQDEAEPILDLACGDGYLLEVLRGRHACIGTDLNAAELSAASDRLHRRIPLIRAHAASLPIATASVGTVGCHYALMLLQPFEQVLAEIARVLRRDGLLVSVLPAPQPDGTQGPVSVFRECWQEVTATFEVTIPMVQDDRALEAESLAILLDEAGFSAPSIRTISTTEFMTTDRAVHSLLLTYLPDLLPPAGHADLADLLQTKLTERAGDDGMVEFLLNSYLVSARHQE